MLDNNRKVIASLYTAGTIVGGWVGHDYMQFGLAFSWAMTSRRITDLTTGKDFRS
jgi:hypothetical protein